MFIQYSGDGNFPLVKFGKCFREWNESTKHTKESGVKMTKAITDLSNEDVKWVHQAMMNDLEEGRKQYSLSEDELATWRILCTIAALNSLARK